MADSVKSTKQNFLSLNISDYVRSHIHGYIPAVQYTVHTLITFEIINLTLLSQGAGLDL